MSLQREMGPWGVLFASVSAIIGSGWLFGSLYAAQMAGPAAILSWIIGGFAIVFVAFCFAELACRFPVAGGVGVFPLYSHGRTASFVISWVTWLGFVLISPIEVQAVIQYSANYIPNLVSKQGHLQQLTPQGLCLAVALLASLAGLNALQVRTLSLLNNILTIWKLLVPAAVVVLFFSKHCDLGNLTEYGGFAPHGAHGVFSSLAVGGVILAFNGFQPGIALAGETQNPKKNIPISIIGSLLICTLIYCFLQISFVTAVPSAYLKHGWSALAFEQEAGPLAGLAVILGMGWLAKLLYADALASPMGTAMIFFAASARSSYAMSQSRFLPRFFQYTTKNGVPLWGVVFNFLISILIFLMFSGWQEMAAFYAAAICLGNSFIPLVLMAIRRQNGTPDGFHIPFYKVFCFLSFYISNLILYWCGWNVLLKLDIAVILGLLCLCGIQRWHNKPLLPHKQASSSLFLLLALMSVATKCGDYAGGLGWIGIRSEFFVVGAISLLVYVISGRTALSKTL